MEEAQAVAKASYERSEELNPWLDCLFRERVFSEIITTEFELDVKSPPPAYRWEELSNMNLQGSS